MLIKNHIYTVAKAKDRIITTLEPDLAAPKPVKPKKDILPQLQEITERLDKINGNYPLQVAALALARASLDLAMAPENHDDISLRGRNFRKAANRQNRTLELTGWVRSPSIESVTRVTPSGISPTSSGDFATM